MNNAKGFWRDEWFYNGTPGTEQDWSIAGDCKCSVTEEEWDLEMKIAIAAFREKKLDGKTWTVQLLRADSPGGVYFAGWVGGAWMDWDRFGDLEFDPTAPVFRFLECGEVAKGDVNLGFEVVGTTVKPQNVKVQVTARDPKGATLYTEEKAVTVNHGQKLPLALAKQLEWPYPGTNTLDILATTTRVNPETGVDESVKLYEVRIPVISLVPPAEWAARVQPWLDNKPKSGDPACNFAYWPSYGVAEASIDLDFFGMDQAKLKAKAFDLSIFKDGDPKPLATKAAPVANLAGSLILETGALAEGDYVAKVRLLGEDAKTAVFENENKFRRKKYPWEGNQLGKDDLLLPPYPPLAVEQKDNQPTVVRPVFREYTVGPEGLFSKIRAGGGGGPEDILAAPITFEAVVGGQPVAVSEAKSAIVDQSPTWVKIEASCKYGPAVLTMKNRVEFDGWYDVNLSLTGARPGAKLDRLTLVIPVWRGADTMYVQRGSDSVAGANKFDAIPDGTGIVWDSAKLLAAKETRETWGSFAPIAFAGNGDKGVWWFAEENRDWTSSDKLPAIQYARTDKGVELRVNILAAGGTLDKERKIHFALLVDPVKKMADERKIAWGYQGSYDAGRYVHMTFGWREWGHSHDGYYMTDTDRRMLREVLQGIRPFAVGVGGFGNDAPRAAQLGQPITLYGSTSNMMLDLPEFATYGGEWQGRSFIPEDKKLPKDIHPNMQGSYDCSLVRDTQECGCNWVNSQVECFLWYHQKLLAECPVNGTWWDNGSSNTIRDYDPVRKEFYQRWNVFTRRDLCKRLNTIGALLAARRGGSAMSTLIGRSTRWPGTSRTTTTSPARPTPCWIRCPCRSSAPTPASNAASSTAWPPATKAARIRSRSGNGGVARATPSACACSMTSAHTAGPTSTPGNTPPCRAS